MIYPTDQNIELVLMNSELYESKKVAYSLGYAYGFSEFFLSVTDVDSDYFNNTKREKGIAIKIGVDEYVGYRVINYNGGIIEVDRPLEIETINGKDIYSLNLVVHPQTIPIQMTSYLIRNDNNCGNIEPVFVNGVAMYSNVGPVMGNALGRGGDFDYSGGQFTKTYIYDSTNLYKGASLSKGINFKIGEIDQTIYEVVNEDAGDGMSITPNPSPVIIAAVDGSVLGYIPQYINDQSKDNTTGVDTSIKTGLVTYSSGTTVTDTADGSVGNHVHNISNQPHTHSVDDHQHTISAHSHKLDNYNFEVPFKDLNITYTNPYIIQSNDNIIIDGNEYSIYSINWDVTPSPTNPPPYSGKFILKEPLQNKIADNASIKFPYVFGGCKIALYITQGMAYINPVESIGLDVHTVKFNATSGYSSYVLNYITMNFMFVPPDVQASKVLAQGATTTKRINVGYYYLLPGYKWVMGVTGIKNHWDTQTCSSQIEFTQPKFPGADSI